MEDFGKRLQKLRNQRGLTQKALANRINKSVSAVSSYETNVQIPPVDVLISIAKALNTSLDSLVGFERKNIIAIDELTQSQKTLLNQILKEFMFSTGDGTHMSEEQKDILDKLCCIFFKQQE